MTPNTFDCATCGSTTHHTIVCDPLPQSATPRPLVMPCSRCGMSAVYNPRPGEDLVVCGDCGYEMGQEAGQRGRLAVATAWEQGYLRGVLDSEGDLERADNPYAEDVPA